jgi:predicted outer membrane repeat protein
VCTATRPFYRSGGFFIYLANQSFKGEKWKPQELTHRNCAGGGRKQRLSRALLSIGASALLVLMLYLLAGYTPNIAHARPLSSGDVSTCSQAALTTALAGGGSVTFSTGDCTITLTASLLITSPTTIDGAGQSVTINGNNLRRIITTTAGVGTLTMQNITLTNGFVNSGALENRNGGALFVRGNLVLSNATILSNTATTGDGGGAYITGTLILTNAQFISNTASGNGGGASVTSAVTLTGGLFQTNTSTSGQGGGLFANTTLVLTGTQFISNTASSIGGGARAVGAVTLNGGLFQNNVVTSNNDGGGLSTNSTLTLTDTQFLSNTAGRNGGGARVVVVATLNGGLFQNNTSTTDRGGGLYAGSIALTGTQFFSNTASLTGGGVRADNAMTLTGGLFQNNMAGTQGGGLYANSTLILTGTQFISNTASVNGGGAFANNVATLNGAGLQGNTCVAAGCTSGGLYANNILTLTQIVTTTDDFNLQRRFTNNGTFTQTSGTTTLGSTTIAQTVNGSGATTFNHVSITNTRGISLFVNVNVTGNFTNTGLFTHTSGSLTLNGVTAQSINGLTRTTFGDLAIANSGAGVSLGQDITVTNRLTLTTDLTTTASYTLNLTAGATSAGTGDVWGNTYREHAFTADTPYSFGNPNVSLNFGVTSTLPSNILVVLAHDVPSGYTYAISRVYTITVTGGGPYSATLRLHYQDSELGNGETNLKLLHYNGVTWVNENNNGNSDTSANWVERSGIGSFSPWALANLSPTAITLIDFNARSDARFASIVLLLLVGALGSAIGLRVWKKRRA